MAKLHEILRMGRTSRARRIDILVREVKDLVVEAWHTPQALQSVKGNHDVRTRVELAMDPALFKDLQAGEASRRVKDLCAWMQNLRVEYAIGYTPARHSKAVQSVGHAIAVEMIRVDG